MTQGARICPHCKRRVDERRAKGLAYCLSCGQPLAGFQRTSGPPSNLTPPASQQYGAPPQSHYGVPPSQYGAPSNPYAAGPASLSHGAPPPAPSHPNFSNAGPLPYPVQALPVRQNSSGSTALVLGIAFGAMGLFALAGAVFFFVGRSPAPSSGPESLPTATVAIESTATAATSDSAPTATAHHPKPVPTAKPTDETPNNPNAPFPLVRAEERMDEAVLAAERTCPRPEGPFGTTVVDITFETDGRVGTLSHRPIGGTVEGSCVTAQFLGIRIGPFQGASRTFSRAVTLKAPTAGTPTNTTTTSATTTPPATSASAHIARPDAGH